MTTKGEGLKNLYLARGADKSRHQPTDLVAPIAVCGEIKLWQVFVPTVGINLLVELQHFLLDGVKATQSFLALFLAQTLQLFLTLPLLLRLAQL